MNEELKVKVGDKVLYQYAHWGDITERIETVVKVTPTGRIRIDGIDCQFDKYGNKMGGDVWSGHAHLSIPTEEDYRRIEENAVISKALSLIDGLNKKALSYDKSVKIVEILESE